MKDERLEVLLSAYLDGQLKPDEKTELEDELRMSSAARTEFWDYTRLHAAVHEVEKRNAALLPEEEKRARRRESNLAGFLKSRWNPIWLPILLALLACGILIAFIFQNISGEKKVQAIKPKFVGEVRQDIDAEWAAGEPQLTANKPMPTGPLHLQNGAVEIALANGVLVAIQSPATFEFQSAEHLVLRRGRVTANTPRETRGFTVETPAAKILDRGTRFGVWIDANGVVEADVFEGKVDFVPEKNAVKKAAPIHLTENHAARLDPAKKSLALIKSDASKFPHPEQVTDNLLVDGDFSSGMEPMPDGLPTKFGQWGGDFCHVTGAEQGIVPHSGKLMLRFLRGDNTRTNGETHPNSELWQIVDLRPHKKFLASGQVEAELSCYFNCVPNNTGAAQRFGMSIFAFRGPLGDPDELWKRRHTAALGHSQNGVITDDAPATWQRLEAKMPVPPEADFLIVQIYAGSLDGLSAEDPVLSGNYADSAVLRLRLAPRLGPVVKK